MWTSVHSPSQGLGTPQLRVPQHPFGGGGGGHLFALCPQTESGRRPAWVGLQSPVWTTMLLRGPSTWPSPHVPRICGRQAAWLGAQCRPMLPYLCPPSATAICQALAIPATSRRGGDGGGEGGGGRSGPFSRPSPGGLLPGWEPQTGPQRVGEGSRVPQHVALKMIATTCRSFRGTDHEEICFYLGRFAA